MCVLLDRKHRSYSSFMVGFICFRLHGFQLMTINAVYMAWLRCTTCHRSHHHSKIIYRYSTMAVIWRQLNFVSVNLISYTLTDSHTVCRVIRTFSGIVEYINHIKKQYNFSYLCRFITNTLISSFHTIIM